MKRRFFPKAAIAAAAIVAAAGLTVPAASAGGHTDYSVEVLVDGRPLTEYPARGTTYVEARREAEYAVRLTNNTSRRVAVALAVDGLNSIDAKTSPARTAAKWVLDPYQSMVVEGWQISSSSARRFYFTTEADSYGEWLGETANLGVIEAAFFRERRPDPVVQEPALRREGASGRSGSQAASPCGLPGRDHREGSSSGERPQRRAAGPAHAARRSGPAITGRRGRGRSRWPARGGSAGRAPTATAARRAAPAAPGTRIGS